MKKTLLGISLFSLITIASFQSAIAKRLPMDMGVEVVSAPADPSLVEKPGADAQPISPIVIVPSKKTPTASGPAGVSLTPQAQGVMPQFNQDLASRITTPNPALKPVIRPLPISPPKHETFQELLTKLRNLRKTADKQVGFFSGKIKAFRNITGSDCQNAYMKSRNAFDKMKKTYDLENLPHESIVPGIPSDQASSINSVIKGCLNSCNINKSSNKQTKYKNYYDFCGAAEQLVHYMMLAQTAHAHSLPPLKINQAPEKNLEAYMPLAKIAEDNLLPAIKTVSAVTPGLPSMNTLYNESPQGKQCVDLYMKVVNMPNPIDFEKLKSTTIAALNDCNPKAPGFKNSGRYALLVRAKMLREKRDDDQLFDKEKKDKIDASLTSVLQQLGIAESQIQAEFNKLKPLFELIQTMNRTTWFAFQEKALSTMLKVYPNMVPNANALDAATVLLLIHDGWMYYQNNEGYLYYQEVSLSDPGLNADGKKTFPEATYGDKIPGLKLRVDGIDRNSDRSKMGA